MYQCLKHNVVVFECSLVVMIGSPPDRLYREALGELRRTPTLGQRCELDKHIEDPRLAAWLRVPHNATLC